MLGHRVAAAVLFLGLSLPVPGFLRAADWPMSRYDAQRTADSPQRLADTLRLQWVRELHALKPAWPDQPKMQFDAAYDPIVVGQNLVIASARTDSVTALDTRTGKEKWRFHADGPIRFAPAAWEGRLFFVSDDGYLYCLDNERGKLLWRFRGGPSDRKVLGNGRLISTWPARGAPVVVEGTVYFAASIWPFMGIFIHALDARTGQVLWTNDADGSIYIPQPHHADSFGGVAPQGQLVVSGNHLLIPGGRSVPACYDRRTGKLVHYRLAENGQRGGGSTVAARGPIYVNGGAVFDVATGDSLGSLGQQVVLAESVIYSCGGGECRAYPVAAAYRSEPAVDRKGQATSRPVWSPTERGCVSLPCVETLIKAGDRLYAGSEGRVVALELPLVAQEGPRISWQATVEGYVDRLVAADDRLFVVTREGRICCYGPDEVRPQTHADKAVPPLPVDLWTKRAGAILETTGIRDGCCIGWGIGTGRLITELTRQSNLHVIVVEADPRKVEWFRRQLVQEGLYGERIAVHPGDPHTFPLPPYLARLMVSEDLSAARIDPQPNFLQQAFRSLRPFGGTACFPLSPEKRSQLERMLGTMKLPGARLREAHGLAVLSREGPLPGSANWTHEHADASNTRVSRDLIVKAPLGLLWFGGPSHEGILPRHGHGPQPQVIDGRIIIEGVDKLRALDAYSGRLLWETSLPGVGNFYNNTAHQPGANASGTNYISLADGIYVAHGRACLRLDPDTGQRRAEFHLPVPTTAREPPRWGYLNVEGDYLVGGSDPLEGDPDDDAGSSSKQLVVMNRHTGLALWSVTAQSAFRHNAICLGGGRLCCIDRMSDEQSARLRRHGKSSATGSRLQVFDLRTGREIWHSDTDVFGTWLSWSDKHDVLVEAGRVARDSMSDEPHGMRAYRASTGQVLWHEAGYSGPAMIHGDYILQGQAACDLLTGASRMRKDPLTGTLVPWTWSRGYGCNTPAASEHLLTFRSGAAGYFDLANDGGTGNFGGFRSSCTNNLIVAGGLLVAPDYTRTCVCSYQNQTSLALVPMPEAEMWTAFGSGELRGTVRRVGVNLGAPGDRKANDGTLWLEYPSIAGRSPALPITMSGTDVEWFRRHSSQVEGPGPAWVAASGLQGSATLTLTLAKGTDLVLPYTVRLHFLEPERVKAGERVFHVDIQGQRLVSNLDPIRETGTPLRSLVKEFKGVRVNGDLSVTLSPASAASRPPVLCGIEVVAEGW